MHGNAQHEGCSLGESKLRPYYLPFVDQSSPNEVSIRRNDRSLQRHFLFDDIFLHSIDNHDQVTDLSEIAPKFQCFWAARVFGEGPEFYQSASLLNMWQTC